MYRRYVARLALLAFVGEPAPGEEARFIDLDSTNCELANLHWASRAGEPRNSARKFVIWEVQEIRRLLRIGMIQAKIASRFKCTQTSISQIKVGSSWGWLPEFDNPKPWDINRYIIEHGCDYETARDALIRVTLVAARRKALRCKKASKETSTTSTPTAP